jgi:hypothetical protein
MLVDSFGCLGKHIIEAKSELTFEYLDEALNPGSPFLLNCSEMHSVWLSDDLTSVKLIICEVYIHTKFHL